MSDKVKVSGCIVTFNNANIIEDCITSILNVTKGVEFKLYVVDNKSEDDTVAIVKNKFPQVTILEQSENKGFGHGHNAVLGLLDSKYHVCINPDIHLKEDAISDLVHMLEKENRENAGNLEKRIVMATPKILNEDGSEQYLPKRDPSIRYVILSKLKPFRHYRTIYTRQEEENDLPMDIQMCTGCFFVIRTALFKKLQGFDERYFMYCEDADLSVRVRTHGRIVFYPLTSVIHKWERENTHSIKGIFRFMTSLVKYFFRWGFRW